MTQPRFYFSTCQVGAEKAVKAELARAHPELKFSFSRPGFVTFKEEDSSKPALTSVKSVFSRLWGEVVGQTKDKTQVQDLLAKIPDGKSVHVFSRDEFVPGDEPDTYQRDAAILSFLKSISFTRATNQTPKLNDIVYDLIWIDDFHLFLGTHTNLPIWDGSPGNIPKINLPTQSPSRAFLKLPKLCIGLNLKREKVYMYLKSVVLREARRVRCFLGAQKSPALIPSASTCESKEILIFLQKMAAEVTVTDLKNINPEWVVMDMSIAPLEALDELGHVIACLRKNFDRTLLLKKGFLTLKLNDWKFADSIPLYLARIQEMGFEKLTATQLVSNRQEFFVMANGFQ